MWVVGHLGEMARKTAVKSAAHTAATTISEGPADDYKIVIEHCNSWSVYKRNAKSLEEVWA